MRKLRKSRPESHDLGRHTGVDKNQDMALLGCATFPAPPAGGAAEFLLYYPKFLCTALLWSLQFLG